MSTLAEEMRQLCHDNVRESYTYKDIVKQIKEATEANDRKLHVWMSAGTINVQTLEEVLIADGLTVETSGDRIGRDFYISW